jgi:RES domain-containing protein
MGVYVQICRFPAPLGGTQLLGWRIDARPFASNWDSGEGTFRYGSVGVRAVYCSLDPATTILEVDVQRGFKRMNTAVDVLTSFHITKPAVVYVVKTDHLPKSNWLRPGPPSGK